MSEEAVTQAYKFRPYSKDDIPFLQNSWGTSYYKGALYSRHIDPTEFHKRHRPIRENFFDKPNTAVICCVACEDETIILGWIAVETIHNSDSILLHYMYVKQSFKGEGIARELLTRAVGNKPVLFTHITERASKIIRSKRLEMNHFYFAPHLI